MPLSAPYTFSTDDLPEADRFETYRSLYAAGTVARQTGPGFYAHIRAVSLGCVVAFERRLNAVSHERTTARVRETGFEHFTVQLNVSGEFHADIGAGLRPVEPGQIVLFDMTRPMRTQADRAHMLTFSVAREVVEGATMDTDALHGLILSSATGGLLADYMMSLVNRAHTLADSAATGATRIFAILLSSAIGACTQQAANPVTATRRERARRHIEKNLGSQELGPASIAQAIGVSRSTLYAIFQPMGGVAKYIQERRLARFRTALARPLDTRSVAQLCYESGFASESHASRAFRQAYGIPPGQFRASLYQVARLQIKARHPAGPAFHEWVARLQGPLAVKIQ